MLFNFLVPLSDQFGALNLFRYLTFRSGGAVITSLIICFTCGQPIIDWLRRMQKHGQPIREDGPEGHLLTKKGTPTMGGVMILLAVTVSTLLWADLRNGFVWIVLFVSVGFGAIGLGDDYLKLTRRNSKGLPGRLKLAAQVAIGGIAAFVIMRLSPAPLDDSLAVPFFKALLIHLGWFF